jgi:hypothetical protein
MGWFAGEHYELIDGELIDKMGKTSLTSLWILDMRNRRMIVHREPAAGKRTANALCALNKYASVVAYREDESVAPLAALQAEFPAASGFKE